MKKSDAVPWEDAKARLEQKWTAEEAGKSVRTRPKPRTRTARPAKKARSPRV